MLDNMKFLNHQNEVVQFGKNGNLIPANTMRDFVWAYNTLYDKIVSFKRSITKDKLPVLFYGDKAKANANKAHEIFEKDITAAKSGRLYIGDYYCRGYFIGSNKKEYLKDGIVKLELQFVTDNPEWIKEVPFVYRINDMRNQGHGYEYGYPYDFLSRANTQSLYNASTKPEDMLITIYGPANNPSLIIGGHAYSVEVELLSNEYLTINTKEKTITKTARNGAKSNQFANRDRSSYIFEKIAVGQNGVLITPEANFDITILRERSEPEWT